MKDVQQMLTSYLKETELCFKKILERVLSKMMRGAALSYSKCFYISYRIEKENVSACIS